MQKPTIDVGGDYSIFLSVGARFAPVNKVCDFVNQFVKSITLLKMKYPMIVIAWILLVVHNHPMFRILTIIISKISIGTDFSPLTVLHSIYHTTKLYFSIYSMCRHISTYGMKYLQLRIIQRDSDLFYRGCMVPLSSKCSHCILFHYFWSCINESNRSRGKTLHCLDYPYKQFTQR